MFLECQTVGLLLGILKHKGLHQLCAEIRPTNITGKDGVISVCFGFRFETDEAPRDFDYRVDTRDIDYRAEYFCSSGAFRYRRLFFKAGYQTRAADLIEDFFTFKTFVKTLYEDDSHVYDPFVLSLFPAFQNLEEHGVVSGVDMNHQHLKPVCIPDRSTNESVYS